MLTGTLMLWMLRLRAFVWIYVSRRNLQSGTTGLVEFKIALAMQVTWLAVHMARSLVTHVIGLATVYIDKVTECNNILAKITWSKKEGIYAKVCVCATRA